VKRRIQHILQSVFGLERYLFIFSIYKILTFRFDKYEKDFFIFLNMLNDSSNVIDIGANIGITTVLLARKLRKGFVYSFEPVPVNFKILQKVIVFFNLKNVKCFNYALGERNDLAKIIIPSINGVQMQGLSYIKKTSLEKENDNAESFIIELKKLDEIEYFHNIRIDAIKIDVENYEYYVLRGAENLISKNKPQIYSEVWDNEFRKKTLDFFKTLKYDILVSSDGKHLIRIDENQVNTQNFFFMYKSVE